MKNIFTSLLLLVSVCIFGADPVITYSSNAQVTYKGHGAGAVLNNQGESNVNSIKIKKLQANLPIIEIVQISGSTYARWNGQDIVKIKNNRWLCFRSTIEDDHWLGTEHNPIDLGWSYQEANARGYINNTVDIRKTNSTFEIELNGYKDKVPGVYQKILIKGSWDYQLQGYEYEFTTTLNGNLENWYLQSTPGWASRGKIEVFDYHSERMSILDRVYNNNLNGDLYDYVIFSNDKENYTKIPKLAVPYTMPKESTAKYFYDFRLSKGGTINLVDKTEKGWEATLLDCTGNTRIEICWSWYDIHNLLENSVPPRNPLDKIQTFTLSQSWLFRPTSPSRNNEISNKAVEVDWRSQPNYQVPEFSRNNKFDTQIGSNHSQHAWLKSSTYCKWDTLVGFDDHYSVAIKHTINKGSAWFSWYLGRPFEFESVKGKRFRFTAMVNTQNCIGAVKVKIGVGQSKTMSIVRGFDLTGTSPISTWLFSDTLTTSTDGYWKELSVEFDAQEQGTDTFVLDFEGVGNAWFDNVVIEPVSLLGISSTGGGHAYTKGAVIVPITVYKNANNQIVINLNDGQNAIVVVCNALGKRLVSTNTTGTNTLLRKSLGSGVYFVTVYIAGNKITKKVIIN